MLYIETSSFDDRIELIKYFTKNGDHELIFWLLPESKARSVCDLKLAAKDLQEGEPVTTYGDDFKPNKTRRAKITYDLIGKICDSKDYININCDSITIYRKEEKAWLACTVGHEGMCLVKDDKHKLPLLEIGFDASNSKPEWW